MLSLSASSLNSQQLPIIACCLLNFATLQVRNLLHKRIQNMYLHPQFQTDVIKPLRMDELMDQEVQHLSGGELQRVAITMCLGKEADLYLIDEPSAYLDSEQRIIAAKVSGCNMQIALGEVALTKCMSCFLAFAAHQT